MSTIGQVYEALKNDSRKGDFSQLVQKDLKYCNIKITEEDIRNHTKKRWKGLVSHLESL